MRAFSGAEEVLGDVGLHSLGDGSRVCFPLTADEEMVSLSTHANCFLAVNEVRLLVITGQFFQTIHNPLLFIPS